VPEKLSDYLQSAPLPSFPAKPARRGGGAHTGKENHQILRLKLKSPDLAETSFIMSTIEEEIEGVNTSQTSQEQLIDSQELIDLGSPSEELRPVSGTVLTSTAAKSLIDEEGGGEGSEGAGKERRRGGGSTGDHLGDGEEQQKVAVNLKLGSLSQPLLLAREP